MHAEQGREIALRIGDNSAEAVALVNIGKANAGLGNFEITFSSFDQAMALFQATQSKLQEIEVLGYYAEYYAKAGQYAKAYEYEVRHNEAVAEMVDEANLEKLAELKALHDSEQQQLKIENLEAEKAKQSLEIEQQELLRQIDQGELEKAKIIRNLLIVVIFAVLLLLAVLFFGYRTQRKSKMELEQLHDELKIKHQELEQLHNQKKQLIEIVSHDLRNPIHGVLGLVDPLREFDEIKNSKDIVEMLDMLESSANRALEIVKNLLTNAHMESGKFELQLGPCRIHPIMEIAFKENITQARIKNQQLKMEILPDDESICVIADREAMIQSVSNLISNAVKYTEVGGMIDVSVVQKNDEISISVSDDGQGIPAGELDSLFIPYATASIKPTGGEHSVGLGLSIVKSFVEQMGGSVACESELGKGSRFTINIPKVVHS